MADETTTVNEVKTLSDGTVSISVERYNDLLETISGHKDSIRNLNERLTQARNEPPVINRTVVNKTTEMLAQEQRMWGGTFMGLGASFFVVGALLYRAGKS